MLTTFPGSRLPLLLLAALVLAGCPGADDGEDPVDETPPDGGEPPPELFTIGGTATGIGGAELILNMTYDTEAGPDHQLVALTNDGAFAFPDAVPDGTEYVLLEPGTLYDPPRVCEFANRTGTVDGADVTSIAVTCEPGYTVGIRVSGLEGPAITMQINELVIQFLAGNSLYDRHTVLTDGESYEVAVVEEPADQSCRVENGSGVINGANVIVDVMCGSHTVSYTVDGLVGSGLRVSLASDVVINDNTQMLVLDEMEITEDGEYTFETMLAPGDVYEVEIRQQPAGPDQECQVNNGVGTIAGDVTDVEVQCPKPYRYYRYDDSYTRWHAVPSDLVDPADPDPPATPLDDGEQLGGALHNDYVFGSGPAVALGAVSGLATEELFARYLDAHRLDGGTPEANGVVHSNATGRTYWLAVESPTGVIPISDNLDPTGTVLLGSNYVTLETWWKFRKVDQASFRLEITRAELLAFDNRDHWFDYESGEQPVGSLKATVDLRIRAFKAGAGDALDDVGSETGGEGGDEFAETFFDVHGRMDLVGRGEPCTGECDAWPAKWELEPEVRADVLDSLWGTDDDGNPLTSDFELETAPYSAGEDQVALARLREPIVVEIDLSDVLVGEEVIVLSEAWVRGHNTFSPEGGTAAYLRDPASFEPEEGTEGADDGVTVETSGLVMIALDMDGQPELDALRAATPPPPPACEPASGPSSELAFDARSYLQSESREGRTPIRVTRSGSTEGSVAARVQLTGGTAVAGEDYEPIDLVVRFGAGSNAARTLELPIIEDGQSEADETLTLELVEPEGCAVIGAQSTAGITIVDDDEYPGAIAFGSASFEVDEGAGLATLTLVRTGGTDGSVDVTIESADGSATGSGDYTPVFTTVTFGDGDAGPHEILVPIVDDLIAESDETVTFTLSGSTAPIGDPPTAVLTIRDDDQNQASTVQLAAAELVAVEAQGTASIAITRHGDVSGAASVTLATRNGTATAGEDYEALDTVVSFAAGEASREVELVILSSADAEGDETLTLELSAPSGFALGTPAAAELVITENDGTAWGAWQPDVEIDAAAGSASHAQIAFDGAGNALAIWIQEAAGRTDVWSNYYQAGVGWNTAVLVEANDADPFAGGPRIGFDAAGNAIAVWTQTDAATDNPSAWANRFVPGAGWGVPELIDSDANEVFGQVLLAVHGSGDAVAVWAQFDGARMNIHANRYTAGAGWSGAEIIDEADEIVDNPHVAVAGNGDILAVWQQSPTGVVWDVWARRYTPANGWESATLLSTTNTGQATGPQVAFDGTGNAFVLWLQNPGFDRAVYATRHTEADDWATPELVGPGDGAEQHRLAVDAAGNAVAVWRRAETVNGTVVLTAFASRFTPSDGWEAPAAISTLDTFYPKAALRPDGHALAVWHQLDLSQPASSAYSVWSNRYTAGSGWRFPEQIGSNGGLIGFGMPNLAIGPNGEAFAIWTRGGEVRVNRFE